MQLSPLAAISEAHTTSISALQKQAHESQRQRSPLLLQLEENHGQQQRPSAAKNK